MATVLRDGQVEVPVEEVQVGDLIRVKPGEKSSSRWRRDRRKLNRWRIRVQEKVFHETVGDEVIGASLNKTGSFIIKATKIGKDTALSPNHSS